MNIRILVTVCLLNSAASPVDAAQFLDVNLGLEHEDNWNRAAQQGAKHDDTVYQLGAKYGYSQGLTPLSGMLYSASLERHEWQHYSSLDNTQLQANVSYQQRLASPLRAPWLSLNVATAYIDYADKKRRASQYEASADLGQNFTHWQYQASVGWKENAAQAEAFSTQTRYMTASATFKVSQALRLTANLGFERGDVVSSVAGVPAYTQYTARVRDDALGALNWQAYRFDADTLWQSLSVAYGWHGKHELSATVQAYDTEAGSLSYTGNKLSLSYIRLF